MTFQRRGQRRLKLDSYKYGDFVELLALYCFSMMFYSFEVMYTTHVKIRDVHLMHVIILAVHLKYQYQYTSVIISMQIIGIRVQYSVGTTQHSVGNGRRLQRSASAGALLPGAQALRASERRSSLTRSSVTAYSPPRCMFRYFYVTVHTQH